MTTRVRIRQTAVATATRLPRYARNDKVGTRDGFWPLIPIDGGLIICAPRSRLWTGTAMGGRSNIGNR